MSQFTIDVDAEAVFLDGAWYTREDLSRRIKAMLDAGDYNVASPSLALQELTQTLLGIRTMVFRCTPELAEALGQLAGRLGQSVGAVIREAATQYITDANSAPPVPAPQPPEPPVRLQRSEPEQPVIPAQVTSGNTQEDLAAALPELPPEVIAGPGALRAAGLEPLELTQLKRAGEGTDSSSEHRWFKQ
jgi:Ribbon-helix-helix protein, copG family